MRVWRRFTGGGAVYLDPGTVCAALALPGSHPAASASIPQMYAPLLDGIVRACRALGADATRDERTVRVGDRKVTGIAAHRSRDVTLVHGTLLVDADLDALRACLAGPRGGDLQGRPRPAASRPDHVALVGGDVAAATAAVIAALAAPGARAAELTAAQRESAAALLRGALPRRRLARRSVARCHPRRSPLRARSVMGGDGLWVWSGRQRTEESDDGNAIEGLHVPGGAPLAGRAGGDGRLG